MAPFVLLYQLDEAYARKYKWDKLDWKIMSADDIDDFDKVSEFFGHDLKTFYHLYTSDTYAEKCDSFLEKGKAQGFTAFLSIVVYCTYGLRRHNHGTHYIVACKENDKKKLSHCLELLSMKNAVLDNIEPSECYILENYRATMDCDLRSFFNILKNDSKHRLEILLSGYLPAPLMMSEESIKRNLSVGRNGKHLERILSSRLDEYLTKSNQPYEFNTIKQTRDVLKAKLAILTNATPPLVIKEAQQAINIQLSMFNETLCSYLRSSDYSDQMLTELDEDLKTVTVAVKALDYGMKNGIWCILGGDNTTDSTTNKTTSSLRLTNVRTNFANTDNLNNCPPNLDYLLSRRLRTPLSYYIKRYDAVEDRHKPDNIPGTQQRPLIAEKNVYNVLVLSSSQETLTALYESLKLIHEPQTNDQVQVTDEQPNEIGFSYIVEFGGFSIRFINEIVDQQVELAELVKNYSAIHGFILLTNGNERVQHLIEVLTTTLPTRARKQNIFFVKVFAFRQNEASDEPLKVKTVFDIFDKVSWKALRQQADSDRYAKHVSSMEAGIHQFTEIIKAVQPVTFNDMKFVIYLKRLAAELSSYASTPFIQRLWATIDAHTVNDDAKSKKSNAKPLDDNELLVEAEHWRGPNETMYNLLRKIHAVKQIPESESNNKYKSNNAKTGATSSKTAALVRQRNGQLQQLAKEAACEANLVAKQQNETTTVLWKDSNLARCESNLTAAKLTSNSSTTVRPISLFQPDVPRLTVLIIGRSGATNAVIIDSIARAGESKASSENEWIVNYDEYEIKYVNIALNNTPVDWLSYPVIHGFIFVIENKVPHLSFIVEKNLRNLLGMIPRNCAKNCCIVNCFLQTSLFSMADASEQLSRFVTAFCENHGLAADEIKHICVDKNSNVPTAIDISIEEFLLRNAETPVTMNAIKVAACLAELGELLDQKPRNSNVERLMASITDRTMSDAALYFREHLTTASPLTNDEWKLALEWDIDEDVLSVLREINTYLKLDEATGLGKVKSTSMFAMKTGYSSTLPQRPNKALTKASSVLSVAPLETANNIACNVNLTAKEQNECIVWYQKKSEFNHCEMNVKVAKLALAPPAAIKPVQYNVVLLGSSASNKQMLLNTIFNSAANNAAVINFGESNDYVIDYCTHSIRYISKTEFIIEQFDIHGLMIVIENGTIEVSNTTDNQIRDALSRFPRRAVSNCCIVNTFTSKSFDFKDAEQQMRELTTKFREQHALTDSPSFTCVDTVVMQAILDHNVTDNANLCENSYEFSKRSIDTFLQAVRTNECVSPADLRTADTWKRLCEAFRPHRRNRNPETLRLMASIAENSLTGLAIYCRKNKGDAQPLGPVDWPAAVAYWNSKDEQVGAVLQELL